MSSGAYHRSRGEAAGAAMGGWLGFDVVAGTVTTARASTCTSSQTLCGDFWWIGFAHPDLLLDLMWMYHITLSRRISRSWCLHTTWGRWPSISSWWTLHVLVVRRRRSAHWPTHRRERIARRSSCASAGWPWLWPSIVTDFLKSSCC